MKTKDLIYIGAISFLAFLLLKNNKRETANSTANNTGGGANSGGLNLGKNMDLPNLTPTPANGLPTEVALNNGNISPLLPNENEPTQIYGGIKLPPPYSGVSIVKENPIDVIPVDVVPVNNTNPYPQGVIIQNPVDVVPVYGYETPINTIPKTSILINPRNRFSKADYALSDFTINDNAENLSQTDTFIRPYTQLDSSRY